MKKIYYTLFVCLMGLLTFSCSEDTDPIYNSEDTTPSTLNAINDLVLFPNWEVLQMWIVVLKLLQKK